ncbi:Uma2 family endonuclease [Phormidesmis priestleyi]
MVQVEAESVVQTAPKRMTFDEFIEWYPEDSEYRYELHEGLVVEMPEPRGKHSQVAGFTGLKLGIESERLGLSYFIPGHCLVKPDEEESGFRPDVIVLDSTALASEPRWEKSSTITGTSARLVIEVVSTNWKDDYLRKLQAYESMSIPEYWIVDYLGLGGRRYIGSPKQPTISVYQLVDGEYEVQQFRNQDRILSIVFPELTLTAEQIFNPPGSSS